MKPKKAANRETDDIATDIETDTAAEQAGAAADSVGQANASDLENTTDLTAAQKYNDLLDRYQRTFAEFDNFRKRTIKEKAVIYDDGVRDTVEKLLPVIDNFERALLAGEDKEDKFYQGVVMIARQMGSFFAELGVELISAEQGDIFDPNVHYAVAHVADEQYDSNVIVDELQKGYQYKGKVIRPSMVRVAN